jgi:hypothetical protein
LQQVCLSRHLTKQINSPKRCFLDFRTLDDGHNADSIDSDYYVTSSKPLESTEFLLIIVLIWKTVLMLRRFATLTNSSETLFKFMYTQEPCVLGVWWKRLCALSSHVQRKVRTENETSVGVCGFLVDYGDQCLRILTTRTSKKKIAPSTYFRCEQDGRPCTINATQEIP